MIRTCLAGFRLGRVTPTKTSMLRILPRYVEPAVLRRFLANPLEIPDDFEPVEIEMQATVQNQLDPRVQAHNLSRLLAADSWKQAKTLSALLDKVSRHLPTLTDQSISDVVKRLAGLATSETLAASSTEERKSIERLVVHLLRLVWPRIQPQQPLNDSISILNSYSRLVPIIQHKPSLATLSEESGRLLAALDPRALEPRSLIISLTLMVRLEISNPEFVAGAVEAAMASELRDYGWPEMTMFASALGYLLTPQSPHVVDVFRCLSSRMFELGFQNIQPTNVVRSLVPMAQLEIQDVQLVTALTDQISRLRDQFDASGLSWVTWALSKLRPSTAIFRVLASSADLLMYDFSAVALTRTMSAFDQARQPNPDLYAEFCRTALGRRFNGFETDQLLEMRRVAAKFQPARWAEKFVQAVDGHLATPKSEETEA